MSYARFARRDRYAHERDDPQTEMHRPGELDARRHSRDARRTMESYTSLRPDEQKAEYRYQYEYEQASYMEIYSHSSGQALAPAVSQHVPDWRLHPLSLTVGSDIACQFHWKAETGTVYTYEHELTCRYIHLDRITRQFCDQQRQPLSADRALAHAMPHRDEMFETAPPMGPAIHEAHEAQAVQSLPAPVTPDSTFATQPFSGQTLVGQWKAASAVRESGELSVGSFVRRADMETQESHERFTASAVKFLQQELPPGTGALVRIYRKLTMKASQVRTGETPDRRAHASDAQNPRLEHPQAPSAQAQATPAQAARLYAERDNVPTRPVQPASEFREPRELNVAAFTRRAA